MSELFIYMNCANELIFCFPAIKKVITYINTLSFPEHLFLRLSEENNVFQGFVCLS